MKAKSRPSSTRKPASSKQLRQRGRPRATHGAVGKETIIVAASKLLDTLPPHRVTYLQIAKKAGVDPALVRYYFSHRAELLLAVIEHILANWRHTHPLPATNNADRLAVQIGNMLDFSRRVRSMQRLMIDECAESTDPAIRKRVRDMNEAIVQFYAQMLDLDEEARTSPVPLFVHVSIIGLCEFYAAAQSMILPLAPARMGKEQLAEKYKEFIVSLMLDGLRSRIVKNGN